MILTDTGPLIALLDVADPHHGVCVAAAEKMTGPFLTSWPCFTEAMHLLGAVGGRRFQAALWQMHRRNLLHLHDLDGPEVRRADELMEKYADRPMDLADASLIVIAEALRLREIFSIDSDFYIYRLRDGSSLTVVPH